VTASVSIPVARRGLGVIAIASIGIILASLALGVRPAPTRAGAPAAPVCQRPLDVVLIIDRSGSMDLVTGGATRLSWAKDAATQLVNGLDANGGVGGSGLHQVGVTTYGNRDNSDGVPSGFTRDVQLDGSSAAAVIAAINAYSDTAGTGNTPFRYGMADGADNMLDGDRASVNGVSVTQVLIFLSDGRPNPDSLAPGSRPSGAEIASYLAAADQAYGIAIGPDGQGDPLSEPDLDLMHDISNPDPDNFRHVVDAASLPDLFAAIEDELLCPDISIVKTADPTELPPGGGAVDYSYEVQNSSADSPFSNVVVTDDRCAPVVYDSGDDGDGLLEFGETWTFTCSTNLTEDTTNTACVSGEYVDANPEAVAVDEACAQATVTVQKATPTPTPEEPTPTPEEPTPTPEGSEAGGTGTPVPSLPDTALGLTELSGPLATIAFGLILVASLGALAYANVRAVRERR
jgi:hypothetical protein